MEPVLADALARAEGLYGDQPGAIDGPVRYTWSEVGARCRALAGGLRGLGIAPGDRVAVLMANGHRYLECYFAIPGSGAVIVPLNNRCTVHEHRAALGDAKVHTLITDDANAAAAAELAGSVERVISGADAYEALLAGAAPVPLGEGIGEDDLAGLFYTGGTTGSPKGVQLSHRNLMANAVHTLVSVGYTDEDRYLHVAPMFHLGDGTSTYAVTWIGGSHTFLPAFEPAAVNEIIGREQVTAMMVVPAMLTALLNDPSSEKADYASLRLVLHGAAPISTSLLRQAIDAMGASFCQGYGMTEAAPFVTVLPREERLVDDHRLRSVGRAVVGVQVTVRRPDGALCDPGETGEVVCRGANFTKGYWNKPTETAAALRDGWYWSGDLGYLTADGYLFLVDRAKDMIISGGENVYSIEVEEAIAQHPAVLEAAVIGVPDDRWGERVHAVVALRPGTTLTHDDLRIHCRALIADYKCPRSMELIDALPRSSPGKVLKRQLREPHWAGTDRQIN